MLRFADVDALPGVELLIPAAEEVEDRVVEELSGSALFASVFRESAARALLLPRRGPERRTPLWQQRLRAKNLLAAVRRYPSFPIVLETLSPLPQGRVRSPRPPGDSRGHRARRDPGERGRDCFSLSLRPLAHLRVRRELPLRAGRARRREAGARALSRPRSSPRASRRHRASRGPRRRGDRRSRSRAFRPRFRMAGAERGRARGPAAARRRSVSRRKSASAATEDPTSWIAKLSEEKRAVAISDRGRGTPLRHRLRRPPLSGLRRTRGSAPPLRAHSRTVHDRGRRGPLRSSTASGSSPSWSGSKAMAASCGARSVRRERRSTGAKPMCSDASNAALSRSYERKRRPSSRPSSPGSFPRWHGLDRERTRIEAARRGDHADRGSSRFRGPRSSRAFFPQRVEDFRIEMLDMLSASGAIVWAGAGALGNRDGRIAFYRRERAPLLLSATTASRAPRSSSKHASSST